MTADLVRIDRFTVPSAVRAEFLARVHFIDALLNVQPGCRAHRVFERRLDGSGTAIITIAEWEDPEAMAAARDRVAAEYQRQGFDPRAFMDRLGITADIGAYAELM
ncbi:MAG: antibiotic biosynthesis monooxygenase [Ancalomicrobiaceae bacterium]|nr:antibiotic biosynthesis monooxygenase [Ancalomicrobiaceae bacterium]